MERLLRALILVQTGNQDSPRHKPALLPLPYVLAKLAFHQFGGDRRPAPIAVAEALATGQADLAVPLAARFLQARHESFPQVWPACPPLTAERGLRWAAALLFPISDTSYQALLEELL